jgi:hypothetical protein
MSLSEEDFKEQIETELGDLSTKIDVPDDIDRATALAVSETGWTFPLSTDFRDYWMKQRTKRHIFFMLCGESAYKFKFKQINLQNRFEHFRSLIRIMDLEWESAKKENAAEFAGVSATHLFGTQIEPGFQYDDVGQDTTYDDENLVIISPSDID